MMGDNPCMVPTIAKGSDDKFISANKNKREAYQGHEDMLRVEKTCNKIIFCMIQTADQLLCKQEDHIQL
jgi:hypothetical protein